MIPRQFCCALTVIALAWSAGTANGQTLYGVTLGNQLLTINPVTGAGTVVGPLTNPANGLGSRGGKLYTLGAGGGLKINELNQLTGGNVSVTNIGLPFFTWYLGGLAFRSDGIGFLGNGDASSPQPQLYKFDISVPNNTLVAANFGAGVYITGLTFNSADVLYGISLGFLKLYTIDQVTGALTLVGPTAIPGSPQLGSLAFDSGGNLFCAVSSPGNASSFYSINPATGAATLIGNIGVNAVQGIAFVAAGPPPPPPPPPPAVLPPPSLPRPGEGTLAGSRGPQRGPEGGFGFGGGQRISSPILLAPQSESDGASRVINASFEQSGGANPSGLVGDLALALSSILMAGAISVLAVTKKTGA